MSNIKWTKTYKVPTKQGTFKLFVSEQSYVGCYASLLYSVLVGERLLHAPGEKNAGYLDIRLEKRLAATESEAFDEIMEWTSKHFNVLGDPVLISTESDD